MARNELAYRWPFLVDKAPLKRWHLVVRDEKYPVIPNRRSSPGEESAVGGAKADSSRDKTALRNDKPSN
jgi:hypothetical protein